MKRCAFALFVAVCLVGCLLQSAPAQAYSININTLTCGDLMSMDDESIGVILIWIDGYYSAKTGSTDFDPDSWEGLAEMVGNLCAQNPRRRVNQAIDDVLRAMRRY